MSKLSIASSIVAIPASIAGIIGVIYTIFLTPSEAPHSPNPAPTNSSVSTGQTTAKHPFANYNNPLSGVGCDSQCLPVIYSVEKSQNDQYKLEIYNQAFGISNVAGTVEIDGRDYKLEASLLSPENMSRPTFSLV